MMKQVVTADRTNVVYLITYALLFCQDMGQLFVFLDGTTGRLVLAVADPAGDIKPPAAAVSDTWKEHKVGIGADTLSIVFGPNILTDGRPV